MPNVHTPQRLEGETREQYVARRARSARIVADMRSPRPVTLPTRGHPQHTTDVARRMRRLMNRQIWHRQFKRRAMAALREARDAARGAA